jgi:hypothetical protein
VIYKSRDSKKDGKASQLSQDRRRFLRNATAAGVLGAVGTKADLAEPAQTSPQRETKPRNAAYQRGFGGGTTSPPVITPEVQADLERRAKLTEELPKPGALRPKAQLDGRFPVYFETSIAEGMRLATAYFAALCRRDLDAITKTVHFPYATYEGVDALVYQTAADFTSNPPPTLNMGTGEYATLEQGTYDILDVLQLHTYDPVNVGLELCHSRYRADGHKIGINQGIYGITNNDGKWGIQLSSIIFTPVNYINVSYQDAAEAFLREDRTHQMAWSYHESDYGNGSGPTPGQISASIANAYNTDNWLRSSRAGVPMEPYNSKGITSRLHVTQPSQPNANGLTGSVSSAMWTSDGKVGYFYDLAGQGIGKYGYTMTLPDARVLHAGPDKAHIIGGYFRFAPNHHEITETRTLTVRTFDGKRGVWSGGGTLGGMVRRDCTNDSGRA